VCVCVCVYVDSVQDVFRLLTPGGGAYGHSDSAAAQ